MKKTIKLILLSLITLNSFSQTKSEKNKFNLTNRPSDHLVLQLSSDRWMGAPDSISNFRKPTSRGLNFYFMLDRAFKSNPNFSVAFGLGFGTSHVFFKNMSVGITGTKSTLAFNNLSAAPQYSRYKLSTSYIEIPVELRFFSNPEKINKSFKAALGAKAGLLLNAHTKSTSGYTEKQSSKSYFNNTRLAATARIGYGYFSLFGSYNFTSIFKENVAENMRLLQVGLSLSGF
jgi:hypothetical protein